MKQLKIRIWLKKGYGEKMVYLTPNEFSLRLPSNVESCAVIMEFINSQDREGVDVYDGDILEAPSGELFVVIWHEEEMRWVMKSKDTLYDMNMGLHKVVGNIFENAILLESK